MQLEPLRLFLQVAATGSFSRAAALASSTQSAVSKR
ncbi:MAG TPA: LysR family transcriptional regulator, partial [Casimicrobiaceae bacterium]|nr:LysR family transcriptional regulator [Casimicrobiaceae bacterium]